MSLMPTHSDNCPARYGSDACICEASRPLPKGFDSFAGMDIGAKPMEKKAKMMSNELIDYLDDQLLSFNCNRDNHIEARNEIAEKCCEVACKAVRSTRPMTPNDMGVLGMEEAIEAIRKAFGVNDE